MEIPWGSIWPALAAFAALGTFFHKVVSKYSDRVFSEISALRQEGEGRAVKMHTRIDTMEDRIADKYVPITVHNEALKRIDGDIERIRDQLNCPNNRGRG